MANEFFDGMTVGGTTYEAVDTGARQLIASLQSALDALTGGDTTTAIESFNEVLDFLEGVTDQETLVGKLNLLNTAIAGKVDKVTGKGLSTNDFTNELLTKLNGLSNYNDTALQTAVNNLQTALQNVYTKSQTYSKSEVDAKVAISSGTYQQAVTRSQTDTGSFMWMLIDTVGSDTIRKPIFHIGNGVFVDMAGGVVEIGEVPNAPTFTMSDETSTPNEFPVGGGTVAISAGTGETIYYTTDGTTPTTSSTEYDDTEPIQVTEETTIKAIAVNRFGSSEVADETFTIAVDHKFQFKIKLTDDNSTEYVPVPAGTRYTMSVDWGDGSAVQSFDNAIIGIKKCAHQYTGSAGDEKTITIRGSKIPVLGFCDGDLCNITALVEVVENTLECETQFRNSSTSTGGFTGCSGLAQISVDALSNNTYTHVSFKGTALTSLPDGLLSHLTKSGVALTSCSQMFYGTSIVFTADQLDELKAVIGSVTIFGTMFYNFQGTAALPDDFFDLVAAGTVTSCKNMTASAGSGLTGDAKALYDVLATKVTGSATTSGCFGGGNFENVSQVPSGWKDV